MDAQRERLTTILQMLFELKKDVSELKSEASTSTTPETPETPNTESTETTTPEETSPEGSS